MFQLPRKERRNRLWVLGLLLEVVRGWTVLSFGLCLSQKYFVSDFETFVTTSYNIPVAKIHLIELKIAHDLASSQCIKFSWDRENNRWLRNANWQRRIWASTPCMSLCHLSTVKNIETRRAGTLNRGIYYCLRGIYNCLID